MRTLTWSITEPFLTQTELLFFGIAQLQAPYSRWAGWLNIGSSILFTVVLVLTWDIPPFFYYVIIAITAAMLIVTKSPPAKESAAQVTARWTGEDARP